MPLVMLLILILAPSLSWGQAGIVQESSGTRVDTIADVTVSSSATLVDAADTNRAALNCTNTSSSVNVRWGDSAVLATSGQRIAAGASVEIKNIAAVYMISEGADVTLSCTKELRQ